MFEVMYGASEDLHSKATQVMQVLMDVQEDDEGKKDRLKRTIRFTMVKLINSIDTSKQLPILETIHKVLIEGDEEDNKLNEERVCLGLNIYLDIIKLKLGSRVSHLSVIAIVNSMNYLMTKKQGIQLKEDFSSDSLDLVATTLSYLYYFKH